VLQVDLYKVFEKFVITAKELGISACVGLKEENDGRLLSQSGYQGFCKKGLLVNILSAGIL
jgi:hypothetical protein